MKLYSKMYAIHLDNLRVKYNITEEDLVDGICTDRQYRRYLSGESKLTIGRIVSFCNKLEISPPEFFYTYISNNESEFSKIYSIYISTQKGEYKETLESINNIDKNRIINSQNNKFLNIIIEILNYNLKKIPINASHDSLSKIIDYPNCLKRKRFDYVDVIALVFIAEIETKKGITKALDMLLEISKNQELLNISFGSRYLMPSIYANTSTYLARLLKYSECIDVANIGIQFSKTHSDYSCLPRLRYIRAHALNKNGLFKESEIELAKCLIAVMNEDNENKSFYIDKISNDFNVNPFELILKYKDELILNNI